ncbi:saccharopine dehydrogenase family protein [Fodinibius sp. AD559]|uniref:saccharopine dehydrogenase family protein n=1 Tax=Fodinibius sp. AD559 TaxID=3424179 RepID=UPI004046C8EF
MHTITVLGAGMVGSAIAADLTPDFDVTLFDIDQNRLNHVQQKYDVQTKQADLSQSHLLKEAIGDADLVVSAVPGFMGFDILHEIIKEKKDVVDISFFDKDPFELDKLAQKHEVTAVVDCGVAPGMSNIILGYYDQQMNIEEFEYMVGGLPVKRSWPYEYKAPFSPIDVIEEYLRPARMRINGEMVTKEALSEPEYVDFDSIGTLEAFNTDGLRTLLQTMEIPNMKEKTLRYPGHIEYMRLLRDTGFLSKEKVKINGCTVRPLDLTAKMLFPKWKLAEEEEEFTVMRVIMRGMEDSEPFEIRYDLYDKFNRETGISSMARTTGYTATAVARLVISGNYSRTGIIAPEFLGADTESFTKILDYLEARGVQYNVSRM